ncbi:uncharacterized protein [Chlorocebus sabaeus]|uniref:uncharacterized protein n=1 Tax=Chlorocebus sabaeus TaxID=60711 RepID=UPI003BF976A2
MLRVLIPLPSVHTRRSPRCLRVGQRHFQRSHGSKPKISACRGSLEDSFRLRSLAGLQQRSDPCCLAQKAPRTPCPGVGEGDQRARRVALPRAALHRPPACAGPCHPGLDAWTFDSDAKSESWTRKVKSLWPVRVGVPLKACWQGIFSVWVTNEAPSPASSSGFLGKGCGKVWGEHRGDTWPEFHGQRPEARVHLCWPLRL